MEDMEVDDDANSYSPFDDLPAELVFQVLQHLPPKARLESRLVCKQWAALGGFGMKFLIQINDESITTAMKSQLRAEILYARDLKTPLPLSLRRTVLQNMNYMRRMFFGPNVTAANMKKILEQVQHVNTLGFSYEHPPPFGGLHFQNLSCLQFQKLKFEKASSKAFKKLLSTVSFPSLKRFNAILVDASEYSVYLAIHLFVVNHAGSLKNVIINFNPEEVKTRVGAPEGKFKEMHEQCALYQDIKSRMNKVCLETVWINACNFEGTSPWNLSCKLVECQHGLECLLLDGVWLCKAIQETHVLNIPQILENNRHTLKRLKLPVTDLDGRTLATCQGLQELGVFVQHDHLRQFGFSTTDGILRNVRFIPKGLRMMDLHIGLWREDAIYILRNVPLDDYVCEGRREQRWKWETFMELWTCATLLKFRSYTTMSEHDALKLKEFIESTPGIQGTLEYNPRKRFAVTDVNFDRAVYGKFIAATAEE